MRKPVPSTGRDFPDAGLPDWSGKWNVFPDDFCSFTCATERTDVHGDVTIPIQHPGKHQAELARLLTPVRCERGVQAHLKTALGIPFGFAMPDLVKFRRPSSLQNRLRENRLKCR